MKKLPIVFLVFICWLVILRSILDTSAHERNPHFKYVDRDLNDTIKGVVIAFKDGEDTVIFETTNLRPGKTDTIISPMKDVDRDSYNPVKEIHQKVGNRVKMQLTVAIRGNEVYQIRPDTNSNVFYIDRCGCSKKALYFH